MPLLTERQAIERLNSTEYKDHIVAESDVRDNFVQILTTDGTGFAFSDKYGVVPKVGDAIRWYGRRGTTRGVDVNEQPVYFKTDEDLDEDHRQWVEDNNRQKKAQFEEKRTKLDAAYRKLPPIFRKRVRWFRKHNPDFRWEYEAYEIMVCEDAVKIANACERPEVVGEFMRAGFDKQKELVPDLEDGHSNNSFGMACRLAFDYLKDEELVFFEHGALVPLVGCAEYGCAHPRPGIEKFAKENGWNNNE